MSPRGTEPPDPKVPRPVRRPYQRLVRSRRTRTALRRGAGAYGTTELARFDDSARRNGPIPPDSTTPGAAMDPRRPKPPRNVEPRREVLGALSAATGRPVRASTPGLPRPPARPGLPRPPRRALRPPRPAAPSALRPPPAATARPPAPHQRAALRSRVTGAGAEPSLVPWCGWRIAEDAATRAGSEGATRRIVPSGVSTLRASRQSVQRLAPSDQPHRLEPKWVP